MQIPAEILNQLKNQKICILGLAKEGLSSYEFLRQHLPDRQLALADQKQLVDFPIKIQEKFKQDSALDLMLGPDYLDKLDQFDLIFKTPGIPLHTTQIKQAQKTETVISSNLQLFLEIIQIWKQELNQEIKTGANSFSSTLLKPITIGVTGTKGKSTTAALIHQILAANQQPSILIGNIGQPALDKLNLIRPETKIVMELSSHQLDQLTISPDIAVIQRVSSEHLDYFPNTQAYIDSKKSITKYQKVNQYVIYDPNWDHTREIAELSQAKKLLYQLKPNDNFDIQVYIKSYYLIFRDIVPESEENKNSEEQIIAIESVPLRGKHNLFNVMPAILVGKLFGLTGPQIKTAVAGFKPLPHRLETTTQKNGVLYVNDSLATMPDAAISGLECFNREPVILLAGGHERNQDFAELAEKILTTKVKAVALFPENGPRLWTAVKQQAKQLKIGQLPQSKTVNSMQEALDFAKQHAEPGDVVLLSPGAASFGIFENYKDRGDQFRKLTSG